ncbi:MAG: NfeD family protein [Lachnospiraceae bacterium]
MPALYWLVISAVLIAIEILTLGLTTIWFAAGALVAALFAYIGVGNIGQWIVFFAVSVVLLILTRPLAMKYLNDKTVRTNADSLIGEVAIVTEEINNIEGKGAVKIQGEEWTARSAKKEEMIEKGAKVQILEISGVKLIVSKI